MTAGVREAGPIVQMILARREVDMVEIVPHWVGDEWQNCGLRKPGG